MQEMNTKHNESQVKGPEMLCDFVPGWLQLENGVLILSFGKVGGEIGKKPAFANVCIYIYASVCGFGCVQHSCTLKSGEEMKVVSSKRLL